MKIEQQKQINDFLNKEFGLENRKEMFSKNDCAKLFHLFCDVDNVTYGGLKKLGFSRTKTLGYGEDCCDFHFYKNNTYN